jgi:hypothetical protein
MVGEDGEMRLTVGKFVCFRRYLLLGSRDMGLNLKISGNDSAARLPVGVFS